MSSPDAVSSPGRGTTGRGSASVCVFTPSLVLTVTIECPSDGDIDEIHFHPGGQGFWIARTLRHLGERPILVAPLGGEAGRVIRGLVPTWGVDMAAVEVAASSSAYVHDRRSGRRREVARSASPTLGRHEVDDLYGRVLEHATASGLCVVSGRPTDQPLPLDVYRRLGKDLASVGVSAVGDLHGPELIALLEGGPLHTLKVSDEELIEDGILPACAGRRECAEAADRLHALGAERVVVTSAARPGLVARFGDYRFRAAPPVLEAIDHRGAGDATTAGLVLAALRGLDPMAALRLACAAGAANVTRRGLGSADPALVQSLTQRVEVESIGA